MSDVTRFKAVNTCTDGKTVEIDAVAAADYDVLAKQAADVTHERNLLGTAIADVAYALGIYNGEVPLDGPQLLMLCEDIKLAFGSRDCTPASPEVTQVADSPDSDWHMNPCNSGHTDVGAANGIAMCNLCSESLRADTTEEAFRAWNKAHPTDQDFCSALWANPELKSSFALTVWARIKSAPVLDDEYRRQVGPVSAGIVQFRKQPDATPDEVLARLFRQAAWLLSQREPCEVFTRLDKPVLDRLKKVLKHAEQAGIVTPDPDGLTVCSHPDCARYACPADKKIACSARGNNACGAEYGPGFFKAGA